MKKRVLVTMMVGAMALANLTACGSKESAAPTTVAETTAADTTAAESSAEETTAAEATTAADTKAADAAADSDFNAQYETYLGWGAKEWEAADEDGKLNAAIAYSIYATEALAGQEFDDAMRAMTAEEMKKTEDVKNAITQLDTTFPSLNMTLKEMVDMSVAQVNSMTETTAAN